VPGTLDDMNVFRYLWTSIQGDPKFMRRVNGWLTIFWIVMTPLSFITHWIDSVAYVSMLSLWALVSGHLGAWQAARVECEQMRATEDLQSYPLEERVVDAIVRDTELSRS
jgi:hypothetical protein